VTENETASGDQDGQDPFDRRVSDVLNAEAGQLRAYAEQLLATGSLSIERAGGVVTAHFSGPVWRSHGFLSWHRRPRLDIEAAAVNGSRSSARGPMVAKVGDRDGLMDEITLHLAFSLAFLEDEDR
jgi:hypothetical protein